MHSMDNYYVSKLLPLMAEAGVHAIANPLINIMLQGRHDTYPKRRGMTRVPEMRATGINVAFGQDCCMDPWYSLGVRRHAGRGAYGPARRAAHQPRGDALLLRGGDDQPGEIMGLDGYGLDVGCNADFVVLQASDPIEAIRLRATRLFVVRRGSVIAETPGRIASLSIDGRPSTVDPASYAPPE